MKENKANIYMHPIRLRIIEYLMENGNGTSKEIAESLKDVPQASLYRHINTLFNANVLEVVEKKIVRGATEVRYKYKEFSNDDKDSVKELVIGGLLSLINSFNLYFNSENYDPYKDMLAFKTANLVLSDEEFLEFIKELGNLYNKYYGKEMNEERKNRRLTLVSSPSELEKGEK